MIGIFQQHRTHPVLLMARWLLLGWNWKITICAPIMVLLMVFCHYAECLIDSRQNQEKKINWQVFGEFVAQYENLIGGHQSTTRSQARAEGGLLVIMNWVCWRAKPFLCFKGNKVCKCKHTSMPPMRYKPCCKCMRVRGQFGSELRIIRANIDMIADGQVLN